MNRRDRVLQQIHEAFRDVRLGDGVTLHEALAIDDGASATERQAARRLDTAQHWQDVPDEHLGRHEAVLSFLDLTGYVFYAPAYMCWLLRTGHATEWNSAAEAQLAFPAQGRRDSDRWLQPHEIFSPSQCQAIAMYLLYVYEVLDKEGFSHAKEPLDKYWSRFL
ncbi:hypothetical protein ASC95_00750 [Pelomonas sp. Root1217]|uniref:DUF6714 family protein n=1 Tax=Pelomonas sp. Root1217 TaxID=1736430 RepID=UPI00070AED3B|nr:DUF6714 family protein [Pelomonas sp. Root1217]KQV60042.1 hypothetical protein ASC95_00750 [Pelomonas sp. Root1217]